MKRYELMSKAELLEDIEFCEEELLQLFSEAKGHSIDCMKVFDLWNRINSITTYLKGETTYTQD